MSSTQILLILLILFFPTILTVTDDSTILSTKLYHENSVFSPTYDPTLTIKERSEADLQNSISRALFLSTNHTGIGVNEDIDLNLISRGHGFLAKIEIGEKKVEQFVYMDTGSPLLWVNCEPCGINVRAPIYDPRESSSSKFIACHDPICDGALFLSCSTNNECKFDLRYASKDTSSGSLAVETFYFGHNIERYVFGCARRANLGGANGILGLRSNTFSIVSQRKSTKFSYCIGNISDPSYSYNRLFIGEQIKLYDNYTPLIIESQYFINLEGMTVGNTPIDINIDLLRRNSHYEGGMIVDTGSTYTFLPKSELKKLEKEVIAIMVDSFLVQNDDYMYGDEPMLCYDGVITRDLKGFPNMLLTFQGDAYIEITAENIFHQRSNEAFCLGFIASEAAKLPHHISILGNLVQQYFQVVIDIEEKKLSFESLDCQILEDYM